MVKLAVVSSLEKIFSDGAVPESSYPGFSMLKNERGAFQAVFSSGEAGPVDVVIESPLKGFIAGYLLEDIPGRVAAREDADAYYLTKESRDYPDLMVPLAGPVQTVPGNVRTVWFEIKGSLPAGDHPVTVMLMQSGNILARACLNVSVIDALLPRQALIYTNWFHTDCLAVHYKVPVFSESYWCIVENYLRRAGEFGMNMVLTPVFTPPLDTAVGGERPTVQLVAVEKQPFGRYAFDFTNFDRWIVLSKKCGMRYWEISHFFTQWGALHAPKIMAGQKQIFGWETDAFGREYRRFLKQFGAAFTAHVNALGIRENCFLHVSDEPSAQQIGAYQKASALVHACFPGFRVIDALSDFRYFQEKLVDTPIPASDHIEPFIGNVPELWTYYCCVQGGNYVSNRFLSMPPQRNRVLGFQLYKYNAVGFLHWAFNFWFAQFSTRAIDPFTETDAGGGFPGGDSFVVYPGPEGKPLDSTRLHVFYEGIQDMLALKLLESRIGREQTMAILEQEGSLTFSSYPRSAAWHLETRERINRAIGERL